MDKENLKNRIPGPKSAILLFILIVLLIPLFESKKAIEWGIERGEQKNNPFRSAILSYASFSEKIKAGIIPQKTPKEQIYANPPKDSPQKEKQTEISLKEIKPPYKFLILGDSFIAVGLGVGEILERELIAQKDTDAKRVGQVSGGLSRPDYFGWEAKAKELNSEYDPTAVIVMIGANDAQTLTDLEGRTVLKYGQNGWNEEYAKRVSNFLEIFNKKCLVFWIGLPIMRETNYSNRIKNLNSIYETEIKRHKNAYFIPTWDLLASPEGKYTAYLPDENDNYKLARLQDGIHLQYFGGKIVANEVMKVIKEAIPLSLKE